MAKAPRSRFESTKWGKRPFTDRYRSALLEENSVDKQPWSRSRWMWLLPVLLVGALLLSGWYAFAHIQGNIEEAAKDVLVRDGIDITGLDFDASWRDIEIEGALPAGTDIERLQQLLEDEVGLEDGNRWNAVDINNATITASVAGAGTGTTDVEPEPSSPSATDDVEAGVSVAGSLDTEVDFDGTRIVLSGSVLTADQSALLADSASEVVGAENVVNNLEVLDVDEAVEGSDRRVEALGNAIATFDGLSMAEATLNDSTLNVDGVALDAATRDATTDAVAASEEIGLRGAGEIAVAETSESEQALEQEVDLLQDELEALQDEIQRSVVFNFRSFDLSPPATATLDKVADAMNRHPGPVIEVGGHTDNQGDEVDNQWLSQRRAESVVAYLEKSVEPDRLEAVGFGESQPVGDNSVEMGRMSNRRVEFVVKEKF